MVRDGILCEHRIVERRDVLDHRNGVAHRPVHGHLFDEHILSRGAVRDRKTSPHVPAAHAGHARGMPAPEGACGALEQLVPTRPVRDNLLVRDRAVCSSPRRSSPHCWAFRRRVEPRQDGDDRSRPAVPGARCVLLVHTLRQQYTHHNVAARRAFLQLGLVSGRGFR